jgi:hypothetical protein
MGLDRDIFYINNENESAFDLIFLEASINNFQHGAGQELKI